MGRNDGSLVGSPNPPLQQACHFDAGRHGDMDRVAGGGQHDWFSSPPSSARPLYPPQSSVSTTASAATSPQTAPAWHRQHRKHAHPHPSKAWGLLTPHGDHPACIAATASFAALLAAADQRFINLHCAGQRSTFCVYPRHSETLERRPLDSIVGPPRALQSLGPQTGLGRCHMPRCLHPISTPKTIPPILIRARIGSAGRQMRGKMRCLRLRPTLALTYCGLVLFPG